MYFSYLLQPPLQRYEFPIKNRVIDPETSIVIVMMEMSMQPKGHLTAQIQLLLYFPQTYLRRLVYHLAPISFFTPGEWNIIVHSM